jgi:hypothetical protein
MTTGMYAWLAFSWTCQRTVTAGPVGLATAAGAAAVAAAGDGEAPAADDTAGEAAGDTEAAAGDGAAAAGETAGAAGLVSAGFDSAGFAVGAAGAEPPHAARATVAGTAAKRARIRRREMG